MDGSYGSGSLLERIVIGGGGGPANTVGRFRNCCCNTRKEDELALHFLILGENFVL